MADDAGCQGIKFLMARYTGKYTTLWLIKDAAWRTLQAFWSEDDAKRWMKFYERRKIDARLTSIG
jgi:hypothetical protein